MQFGFKADFEAQKALKSSSESFSHLLFAAFTRIGKVFDRYWIESDYEGNVNARN